MATSEMRAASLSGAADGMTSMPDTPKAAKAAEEAERAQGEGQKKSGVLFIKKTGQSHCKVNLMCSSQSLMVVFYSRQSVVAQLQLCTPSPSWALGVGWATRTVDRAWDTTVTQHKI